MKKETTENGIKKMEDCPIGTVHVIGHGLVKPDEKILIASMTGIIKKKERKEKALASSD